MIDALLKGFTISLLLIFSIGPLVFTIIKQSINNGRIGGFSFVGGIWLSDLLWVLIANGFSELMQWLLDFKKPIGIAGSAFLVMLGVYYLFFKKIHLKEDENKIVVNARTHAKLIASGFLINTLNPGVIAFWLTTTTAIAATHTIKERIIIFSTVIIVNTASDILKVLLAGKLRSRLNEKTISLINKISGVLLLGFGILLFFGVIYTASKD